MTLRRAALLLACLLPLAPVAQAANVKLGIDVLEEHHFAELKGMRIGLITNATGIDSRGVSDIDVLRNAPGVQLVALFGPEHGVYGTDWAGQYVGSSTDLHTGLPVYSLYGPTRKPTPEMLQGLDALVYDIQDIGCRSYTFISTMGLAMEAAGEAGIKFYVLDRPDPLNGNRIEGPMLDPRYRGFTDQWNIPYVYGLTPGELAYMIRDTPGWITKAAPLTHGAGSPVNIVRMEGWYRSMYFEDTGLMWVPTSPHIPTAETALNYVVTGFLGEAGGIDNGVGYTLPFAVFGHPAFDSFGTAREFNELNLPGVYFEPVTFKPFYSLFKDQAVNGVQLYFTDRDKANLCDTAVHILHYCYHQSGTKMFRPSEDGDSGPDPFDHIAGGSELRVGLQTGSTPEQIIQSWQPALAQFRQARRPYLLYGDRPKGDAGNY
jgi:uncharacterized protein YbbC (DUF1343 family)